MSKPFELHKTKFAEIVENLQKINFEKFAHFWETEGILTGSVQNVEDFFDINDDENDKDFLEWKPMFRSISETFILEGSLNDYEEWEFVLRSYFKPFESYPPIQVKVRIVQDDLETIPKIIEKLKQKFDVT